MPTHSQDFLVLGSQPLSALRDKISCLNDSIAVGDLTSTSPDAAQVAIKVGLLYWPLKEVFGDLL